jgi:chromosome segregation ATPase
MRAASEHPRIATAIATALIVILLVGVWAGSALGGSRSIRSSGDAQRVAGVQLAQLREQQQSAQAQSAQLRGQVSTLRGQVATLTTQLARARQSQQRPPTGTHARRRRAKH